MKLKVSVFVFHFLVLNFYAQNNSVEVDSLYNNIKITANDTIKANSHYELGWLLKLNNLPSAKAHTDTALVFYKKLKLEKKGALSNFQFSVLYRLSGEYTKAIESLNKYQLYVESVKDTINTAFAFSQKGIIYTQKGDYENGLKQFYESYTISEASNNFGLMANTLNSIGITYTELEKYPEAIENLEKAITIYQKIEAEDGFYADTYNNIGNIYNSKKDYVTAKFYYDKALNFYEKANNERGVSLINMNLGLVLIEQKQYQDALPFLEKAYETQSENGYKSDLALTLSNLGEAYFEIGNYDESETFLKEGLALKSEDKVITEELNFELYRVFQNKNDYKQALHFHKEYVVYKDSILNEENLKNINALQTQFETVKKDKEIALQQNELQKKSTQINYMAGIAIGLLITSILLWFLYQQRQKRKNQEIITLKREHQVKTLESLIEGEENERLRIAKELHDGVNGDLSAIKFKLSSLLELNNTVIKEAITMIDNSCSQVRAISHNLVPPTLESFNLVEATEAFCQSMNETFSQNIDFQFIGKAFKIDKKVEINIYRIIQELINNSLKHAEATEINVQISSRGNYIQITVEDDGKGFDVTKKDFKGIGLKNIESRLDYLNAEKDVVSNKNGTSYTIEIDTDKLNGN